MRLILMPRSEFKILFDYFARTRGDTSGQVETDLRPDLQANIQRFLSRKMKPQERVQFFRELRWERRAIEFMVAQINSNKRPRSKRHHLNGEQQPR